MTPSFGNTLGIVIAVIFLFLFTRKALHESGILEKLKSIRIDRSK